MIIDSLPFLKFNKMKAYALQILVKREKVQEVIALWWVIAHQWSNPSAIACGVQRLTLALQVGIAPENRETFLSVKGNAHPTTTTTTEEKVEQAIALSIIQGWAPDNYYRGESDWGDRTLDYWT